MPGLFQLYTNQRRFYTCCGRVHVKLAFLFIIVITVVAEVLEILSYFMGDVEEMSSFLAIVFEIWEVVVTLSMIIAIVKESTLFMLPFIGEMFVVVIMMVLLVLEVLFCLVNPYSSIAEKLFVEDDYTFIQREKKLLAIFVFVSLFTALSIWFLNVGLVTYMYFDYATERRNRKSRRHPLEQAPVLVQQEALPSAVPTPPPESFPNPNYNPSDDEEDEVFDVAVQPQASVV